MLEKFKKFIWPEYNNDTEEDKKKNQNKAIIWLVFIVIVVILVRLGGDTTSNNSSKNTNNNSNGTSTIKDDTKKKEDNTLTSEELEIGYDYIYTINTDTTKEVITGTRYNDKEKLTIINTSGTKSYAKLSSNFLEKGTDGEYHLIEVPSVFYKYCIAEDITDMLEGIAPINGVYYVPIATVIRFINGIDIGTSELKDTVIFEIKDNKIKGMTLDFSNSINNTSLGNIKKLQIKIEYSNIGNTKDFDLEVE